MNAVAVVLIYLISWWCIFLALLPVGVKGRWESEADGVVGADPGAPSDPALKKKALWASAGAAIATAAISAMIVAGSILFER